MRWVSLLTTRIFSYAAVLLRDCGRLTVRIHSAIAHYRSESGKGATWAKLWYLLRGLNPGNDGFCKLPLTDVTAILRVSSSTVFEWLREGEAVGAFRKWWTNKGTLVCILTGLEKLTERLGLDQNRGKWGVTTEIALTEIHNIKAWATCAVAQRLQADSHYAARAALSETERKRFRIPKPEQIFDLPRLYGPSDDLASEGAVGTNGSPHLGVLPCVLHVGASRVFVSKGFIPYGASQKRVAEAINYRATRTVRRHIQLVGLPTRQLVQAKAAYTKVKEALGYPNYITLNRRKVVEINTAGPDIAVIPLPTYLQAEEGAYLLEEPNGHSTTGKHGGHLIKPDRFFKYWGKTWLYRCNLYEPTLKLCSMAYRHRAFEELMSGCSTNSNAFAGVVSVLHPTEQVSSTQLVFNFTGLGNESISPTNNSTGISEDTTSKQNCLPPDKGGQNP